MPCSLFQLDRLICSNQSSEAAQCSSAVLMLLQQLQVQACVCLFGCSANSIGSLPWLRQQWMQQPHLRRPQAAAAAAAALMPSGLHQHVVWCLVCAQAMLEEDALRFDAFLKENDEKVQEAIKHADTEAKAKQDKVR